MTDGPVTVAVNLDDQAKPKHGWATLTPELRAEYQRKAAATRARNKAAKEARGKKGAKPARSVEPSSSVAASDPTEDPLTEACAYLWGTLWRGIAVAYEDPRLGTSPEEDTEAAPALAVAAKALGADKFIVKRRYEIGGTLSVGRQTAERIGYIREDGWWPGRTPIEEEDEPRPAAGWTIPGTQRLHDASSGAPAADGLEWQGGLPGATVVEGLIPPVQTGVETDLPVF